MFQLIACCALFTVEGNMVIHQLGFFSWLWLFAGFLGSGYRRFLRSQSEILN